MELTKNQIRCAQDLIRLCVKYQCTMQSDGGKLFVAGMNINKVNTDECHVLNPNEKLAGVIVTLKGVKQIKDSH